MIEITGLSKNFSGLKVIDKMNLSIQDKTIFGLVGPNGAGKSTTINILTGIISASSGNVKILGYDLKKDPVEIKKRIGVIPERLALFDGLTGEEHLTFVGKTYGLEQKLMEDRVKNLLNFFDLYSAKDRLIETYSQGMRKKTAFAAAIIHSPKVLFLDEPFENVDPVMRKKMKEILVHMKNNGATILITSHALIEVEDFCDEVAILNKGEIVFQSKTENIRNQIKDEVNKDTYKSLEEIFLDIVTEGQLQNKNELSWL